MTISIEEVNYIARLAKIKFNDDEAAVLANQFGDILKHFENLNNEDLSGIDTSAKDKIHSLLRKDKASAYIDNKNQLFKNVKKMRDDYIEIPKIIE